MRGYAGIYMNLSACVHFVRNDEVTKSVVEIAQEVKKCKITCAYVDYDIVKRSGSNIANSIGSVLRLECAPYRASDYTVYAPFHASRYSVRFPWVPFLDDLITLSEHTSGLVIIIDNADRFFADARNDAFDLIEAFLVQFQNWFEKKKPCHLCFQMEKNDLIRRVFLPVSQLRVVR